LRAFLKALGEEGRERFGPMSSKKCPVVKIFLRRLSCT